MTGTNGTTANYNDCDITEFVRIILSVRPRNIDWLHKLPRFHPTPKELKAMYPYKQIDYVSIVPRGTFNRKLLFPFSGYLPKRVRARIKSRGENG